MDGAATLARAGDAEGYARYCRRMLDRFQDTRNPVTAGRVAKVCLFYHQQQAHWPAATRMADLAVTLDPNHWVMPYSRITKALAEYRNGRYESAVAWCRQVLDGQMERWFQHVQTNLVLAMALFRQGNLEEARGALARASSILEQQAPGRDHDSIISEFLLQEAESLVGARR
jgi:tetratricopeptide (TPR) repeat protein